MSSLTVQERPVEDYALWEAYRAGVQPDVETPQQPVEAPPVLKGIIQIFSKDVFVSRDDAMLSMISKYSNPSAAAAATETPHDKFVFDRRVHAHLGLLPLSVY